MAADTDWSKVDQVLGRKRAAQASGIYRYGLLRSDLNVTVDGVTIKPSFALAVDSDQLYTGERFSLVIAV